MSKFRIEGLSDINKVLSALPKSVARPTLIRFGKKRLEPMRDAAKANAPVDEGQLRDEIIISTRQKTQNRRSKARLDRAAVEIAMGPSTEVDKKAVPQEFGFRDVPPKGFMRHAWDGHAPALLDNLAKDLGEAVDATAKRHAKRMAKKGI